MLQLKTPRQVTMIANSVARAINQRNIDLLTKQAYNFLYLCSGFIAHYNLYGFREVYRDTDKLVKDIIDNQEMNQWKNFHKGERDYEYYMQKKTIYNLIIHKINL